MKFEWEEIYNINREIASYRAKVHGGWILRNGFHDDFRLHAVSHDIFMSNDSMVFVPDPNHEWVIE